MRRHRTVAARRWPAAVLPAAAAAAVVAALVGGFGPDPAASAVVPASVAGAAPAVAAPGDASTAGTTVRRGQRIVSVEPASGIPDKTAAITVSGSGFSADDDLWVAICADDGSAPGDLSHCLGGPIPDENATTSWGVVTGETNDAPPGPVVTQWGDDGSFSLTLQVLDAAQHVDCVTGSCSVYVRSAGDRRNADVAVPVAFAAPGAGPSSTAPGSTSSSADDTSSSDGGTDSAGGSSESAPPTTSASPTTSSEQPTSTEPSTTAAVPTTVDAQSVLLDSLQPGRRQVIVFTGFQPGEDTTVTLSGNPPLELESVPAGPGGVVRVEWTVPQDFPPGGYTMRVEGADSLRVGIAAFTVAPPPTSSAPSSQPPTSSSASASTSTPETTSVPASPTAVDTATSTTPDTATSSTAVSTSDTAAGAIGQDPAPTGSSTPWWLWIILAALLLLGLVAAAVILARRHRQDADAEYARREAELAAAAAEHRTQQGAPPGIPEPPQGGPAMTDLDEHPDRPFLFSHQPPEHQPPTEVIGGPEAPTEAIPPAQPGGEQQGPGTQRFDPFADDAEDGPGDTGAGGAAGPGTQRFDPFADDAPPDPDDPRGGWHPPA